MGELLIHGLVLGPLEVEDQVLLMYVQCLVQSVGGIKEFLQVEGRAQFFHLTEQGREGFKNVCGHRMKVNLLCTDDALLVTLRAQHLENLGDLLALSIFDDSISLCGALVDLFAFLGLPHDIFAL